MGWAPWGGVSRVGAVVLCTSESSKVPLPIRVIHVKLPNAAEMGLLLSKSMKTGDGREMNIAQKV